MTHQGDLILSHDALGIWHMVGRSFRLAGFAIAAQIRGDNGKVLCQARRDGMPHHMRLGVPVEEQQWRTATAMPDAQRHFPEIDPR